MIQKISIERIMLYALIVCAIFVRIHSLHAYHFWGDEAWVAYTIEMETLQEMLFPNRMTQSTPSLFLVLVRYFTMMVGASEITYRLLPFIGNILTGIVGYFLCKELKFEKAVCLLFVSLWAFNPLFIRYAAELKQYSTDTLAVVLLLYLTERVANTLTKKAWLQRLKILFTASWFCISLSHTAIFVIPIVVGRLLLSQAKNKNIDTKMFMQNLVLYCAFVSAVFCLLYYFITIPAASADWLNTYWNEKGGYLSTLNTWPFLSQALQRTLEHFEYFFSHLTNESSNIILKYSTFITFVSTLFISCIKRRWELCLYLLGPFFIGITISALSLYPYLGMRTSLYLAPICCLGICGGFNYLLQLAMPAYTNVSKFLKVNYDKNYFQRSVLAVATCLLIVAVPLQSEGAKEQYEFTDYINEHMTADDLFVTTAHSGEWYYLNHKRKRITLVFGPDKNIMKKRIIRLNQEIDERKPVKLFLLTKEKQFDFNQKMLDIPCQLTKVKRGQHSSLGLFECETQ